jgi:hypothetical protein
LTPERFEIDISLHIIQKRDVAFDHDHEYEYEYEYESESEAIQAIQGGSAVVY